jgi:hypothetical protein
MRQDYIEPEYINGVYDKEGRQVIRPLNASEKEFLNSFYEEVINANFLHDSELRSIYEKMKPLKNKKTLTEEEEVELTYLQLEYFRLADDVLLYTDEKDQRKLYGENNARNRCLYNRTKSIGMLDELNDCTYDSIHDKVYSDPRTGENLLLNQVEPKLKHILRKKKDTKKES